RASSRPCASGPVRTAAGAAAAADGPAEPGGGLAPDARRRWQQRGTISYKYPPCHTTPTTSASPSRADAEPRRMETTQIDDAVRALDGAALGPTEIAAALGFDPFSVLNRDERATVETVPFSAGELTAARDQGEVLVLRIPRDTEGPLTMLRLAARLSG